MEKWGCSEREQSGSPLPQSFDRSGTQGPLFPEWLRFLKGVVDSSDLPLNVSREVMQDSELLSKLSQVLTKSFLSFLNEQSKKEEKTIP